MSTKAFYTLHVSLISPITGGGVNITITGGCIALFIEHFAWSPSLISPITGGCIALNPHRWALCMVPLVNISYHHY